ncbi:MAG: hypothetical protein IGS48_17965 [Oscillatoriales cyanobacterium C42_A2020_001]|nr:hypothetical protein [Leptolyngbyaceae cyanobacterium C42_A2020_001]
MPRQKTEAAAYLDIYKLVTERKRLEQELEALEQRRDRIIKRLEVLDQQTAAADEAAHQLRAGVPQGKSRTQSANAVSTENFNTLFLEY